VASAIVISIVPRRLLMHDQNVGPTEFDTGGSVIGVPPRPSEVAFKLPAAYRPSRVRFSTAALRAPQQYRGRHGRHRIPLSLNNDIEASDGTWLGEMLSRAAPSDVGAVGAMLLYPRSCNMAASCWHLISPPRAVATGSPAFRPAWRPRPWSKPSRSAGVGSNPSPPRVREPAGTPDISGRLPGYFA
jgi:hypothetical protein